jgi:hypothetical protein
MWSISVHHLKRQFMASIPGIPPSIVSQPIARIGGSDADGDNDGTKGAAAKATPPLTPVVAKPTETMGNNVNTFA